MTREIDDVRKRQKYKEQQYGDKKSRPDDYTGERVFMGNDRDAKYKHPINKISDTDHITPISVVEERYKWLSKEEQQALANNEHNYATVNAKLNRSKGDLENHEYLARQLKKGEPENLKTSVRMLVKEADSHVHMDAAASAMYTKKAAKQIASITKSASGSLVTGATNSLVESAIPLTSEAVRKLCKVANGEESLGDATKEMGKIVVDTAVMGGARNVLFDVVNSKNPAFSKSVKSKGATQVAAVAVIVKESAVKYINGEIDEKKFIEEVGEKGTTMVAGMIGGEIGKEIGILVGGVMGTAILPGAGTVVGTVCGEVIGEILGTIITTAACSAIISVYTTSKHLNDYKLKESQVRQLEADALKEIQNQRNEFKSIIERENKYWDDEIQNGFDMILSNACKETYNLQGVTEGLDKILAVFGKSVKFKNLDEYEAQLDLPLKFNF